MVMSQDSNLRPARIIPDLSSDIPNTPRNSYLIPFVPSTAEENGAVFRGDYCFDSNLIECPLFNICSLVIKDSKVISARLNTNDLSLLSEDIKTDLTRTVLDPVLNEKVEKPFTISSLNEEALCTKDLDLDPFYNRPKPKIIIPPMPEEPPTPVDETEPIKEDIAEIKTEDLKPEPEPELKTNDFEYVVEKLPGFEEEPPLENPDFDIIEIDEIHPDNETEEFFDDDLGINSPIEQVSENETTQPEPFSKDEDDGYEFDWQRYIN